ncbi:MAG TPA: response regulator [Aggregatilineales bacterium]|nr:response regulator [Aggregatilineales bacterium]
MKKHHVLIVDDNPEIRSLIFTTLGETFFTLGEAANGAQALDYLTRHDLPDVMILDLAMPGISGIQVMEQVKGDPETAHIEVVVLSANADQQAQNNLLTMGAAAILAKPFSPLELLQTVEALFDQ